MDVVPYANDVYLITIWEYAALVQWMKCEHLGEHLIHWICDVFSKRHDK